MAAELRVLSFEEILQGASAFLDESLEARAVSRRREEEALNAALEERADQLRAHGEETFRAISAAAEVLLPQIAGGEALHKDALLALDVAVVAGEAPYGAPKKSDRLPEQLLAAEPGSRLYPNLLKKVEAVCTRGRDVVEQRCRDALAEHLLRGGSSDALDRERREAEDELAGALRRSVESRSLVLAQSDHRPLLLQGPTPIEEGAALQLLTWNVLEFPSSGSTKPMVDGVSPHCDQLQKILGRKGSEEKQLLLDAMASDHVISRHYELVLQVVHDALTARGADAALLQEVSSEMGKRLAEACAQHGWDICLSREGPSAGKCGAITAIVSRKPFEEKDALEVQENKKVRSFAAARSGNVWLVSCHVPHEEASKKKGEAKGGNVEVACRVVRQLAERLVGGGPAGRTLVAGGDFNADVRAVSAQLLAEPLPGASCELCAPEGATQLGTEGPIDGLFCVR